MWATRLSIVDWVYFKTQTLLETLRTRNQPQEGLLCLLGSRTFVAFSWMRKKQTSVSHSSTESETISLDAKLRMDGPFAFDLWNVVIEVLRSTNNTKRPIRPAPGNGCGTGTHSSNKDPRPKHQLTSEVLINCQLWTTYQQTHILLRASLISTSLK